ncbi:Coenzyme A transferase [Candidatus Magnetomorum sp. HK-1]|nr:Coenzyme A transferase [Candidatus Magnetomorum sp. HK-1]
MESTNKNNIQQNSGHPMLGDLPPSLMKKGKIVTAEEAIQVIHDGDTIVTGGFVGIGFPEEIAIKLKEYYKKTGHPKDLTLVYAAGQGDGIEKGLNHFGQKGLVGKVIGGHWGLAPKLQALAINNDVIAYNLPQGVISHMFRDIAAKKPRTITTVGLGTFVDPRNGGGKLNDKTIDDIVEIIQFDGQDYLAYKTFPINVAILRGTTADTDGNITMEHEALTLESLSIAMAARNSNGFVIVQVERIAERGSLNSRNVKIPGILVDCVVVSNPENHWQTFAVKYNPAFSGEIRVPMQSIPNMKMNARKIIARRAAMELKPNSVVNLGIGVPEGIAAVANEEGIIENITLTAEPGVIGGLPAGGLNFGAATNTEALIDQPYQFDFYDGGGLDIAFLGLAQADSHGNLNVSKFGPKLSGAGGFINISQNARKIVFVGTFTAIGIKISIENGKCHIDTEGKSIKFIKDVEHITFSGQYAIQKGQPVLYITERCVFELTPEGMKLIEIAPGVDLERDILEKMTFKPIFTLPVPLMDQRIFIDEPMGIRKDLFNISLSDRMSYNEKDNLFFVNFESFSVNKEQDIKDIKDTVEKLLTPLNQKVYTIVNYDNFSIRPDLIESYTHMVIQLVERFYSKVTRYTTSTFLRMKLKDALVQRNVPPHIYESKEEARIALKS